ncbi:hypothetical protein NFF81_18600, partial [Proteus mirabilis]|nr:hypothetical protein [Proteus mirabilis]
MDHVFPVYTGMNRCIAFTLSFWLSVPRVYGDEPRVWYQNDPQLRVFPVYTGMNRCIAFTLSFWLSVPRV